MRATPHREQVPSYLTSHSPIPRAYSSACAGGEPHARRIARGWAALRAVAACAAYLLGGTRRSSFLATTLAARRWRTNSSIPARSITTPSATSARLPEAGEAVGAEAAVSVAGGVPPLSSAAPPSSSSSVR